MLFRKLMAKTLLKSTMNIDQTLKKAGQKLLNARIPNPHLEVDILLSNTLKKTREFILSHPKKKLTRAQTANYELGVAKRAKGAPVAYITGHKEFYGLDFLVNKYTLIPRPETELMIDTALELLKSRPWKPLRDFQGLCGQPPLNIIDIGTGSGCIIISLIKQLIKAKFSISPASHREAGQANFQFLATDISEPALILARKNAVKHRVKKQIKFYHGNLLESIIKNNKFLTLNSQFLILANLPYLTPFQIKNSPTIQHEPRLALAAGPDGLKYYRRLFTEIAELCRNNKPSGYILCEIDPGQTKIKQLIKNKLPLTKIAIKKDLRGHDRLVIIKL